MSNNKIIGKRYSLTQLFTEHNFVVEVPMIQRDYAQGRTSKKEVRDLFLDALFNYLKDNIPNRDLDFIYGNIETVDSISKFIPLDGQQRLTTLFLLHWYLGMKEKSSKEHFIETFTSNTKSRFIYNTRPSSNEFINALLKSDISTSNLKLKDSLSVLIKNQGWFFLSWQLDPTIQSILNMLDAIHLKFYSFGDYYERLINIAKPIITFQFLNLKESSLSEDLYIKMNSRGKPLTSFENFKAKLEQHIKQLYGEDDKPFIISIQNNEIKYSWKDYFSNQIETKWANLFWNYRKLVGKPDIFDEELMNFIRVIFASQFAVDFQEEDDNFSFLIKDESATAELTTNISFYKLKELGCISKNGIKFLFDSLDALSNDNNPIQQLLKDEYYFNITEIFEKALKYSLTMPERVLLHGYLKFITSYEIQSDNIFQWMRVLHNLVENSRIEKIEDCATAIRSVEKLLVNGNQILKYLRSNKCKIDFFVSWQTEEERIKSFLIERSDEWHLLVLNAEKSIFHKGQVGYILEFTGILDYFKDNQNCSWSDKENGKYFKSFKEYLTKTVLLFDLQDSKNNENYLVERALLCKGDYLVPAEYSRYNFSSAKKMSNYQKYYSWKRILRLSVEDAEMWKEKRAYFNDLFIDESIKWNSLENSLNNIVNNKPQDWRGYFVNNPELIRYCKQGFIERKDDNIQLFNASQINHLNINMRIYNLYTMYLLNEIDDVFKPFKYRAFEEVKGTWDDSFVYLNDWCFQRINYTLQIFFVEEKFLIAFKKQKGKNIIEDYNSNICEILEQNKFKWDDKSDDNNIHAFIKKSSNESTVFTLIKNICQEFNAL